MGQAEPNHNVVSATCGGGDGGGSVTGVVGGDEYVTAAASMSMAPSSHESSTLYVTAGLSEVPITDAIEKSKDQGWSELAKVGTGSLNVEDALTWEVLKKKYRLRFRDDVKVKLGRVIAEGGQAQIYEAEVISDAVVSRSDKYRYVAKVFKMEGFSLADFQSQWPVVKKLKPGNSGLVYKENWPIFDSEILFLNCSTVDFGLFLEDGRFAFIMQKCWGDLRTLINLQLKNKNFQEPPFSDLEAVYIMRDIAFGMLFIHANRALHRDLKAANVLISINGGTLKQGDSLKVGENCEAKVADFESSMLVQGTGFWRAPEVLKELQKPRPSDRNPRIWTEKVDVYSYAMTCYEILTGFVPFLGYEKSDWDRIIVQGERPHVPDYVNSELKDLMERCWHADPSKRPSFDDIYMELEGWARLHIIRGDNIGVVGELDEELDSYPDLSALIAHPPKAVQH